MNITNRLCKVDNENLQTIEANIDTELIVHYKMTLYERAT